MVNEIDGASIIKYLVLDGKHVQTGSTRHFVDGQLLQEIYGLAICKCDDEAGFYLFYCDENWNTLTDTYHDSLAEAERQAEYEFTNPSNSWVKNT